MNKLPWPGDITRVSGIHAGHFTSSRRPTGCSVVLAQTPDGRGATGGVDVRGAAPGTRETDLLAPGNQVDQVHAVVLSGGSAWGLCTASGVMRWLDEHEIGLQVGERGGQRVPIVPAAVLFDLNLGDARIRPDAQCGYMACAAAHKMDEALAQGNVGAGAGASVGKLFGMQRAMKGGIGSASIQAHGITVGALVAVNALGDVINPHTDQALAGARSADGQQTQRSTQAIMQGATPAASPIGTNTSIGVIATDAPLSKAQAQRLAGAGHDGLARAIQPAHTLSDGDTLFTLATGHASAVDFNILCILAAEAVTRACINAVSAARGIRLDDLHLPSARDLQEQQEPS